ncbi:MAG: tRNA threonylcarbamoyladenosine dehydratase [Clostridiales bacterium]|nr:tRNA threonylcarbamoyladenosine dehydratase [Clostridiales bacterium]
MSENHETIHDRTRMLLGAEALDKLRSSRVLLFGVGGVGSFTAEALVRTGVGTLGMVDFDVVSKSNINRQLPALNSTVGLLKVQVMAGRLRDINPEVSLFCFPSRLDAQTLNSFDLTHWDYIVDAIDDVPAKLLLIKAAQDAGIPIISSMGTGNKMDPSQLQIVDLKKTHTCPLARAIRREAERMGIGKLPVLFSPEKPSRAEGSGRSPSSTIFVPASAGLMIAARVVTDLIAFPEKEND